MPKYKSGVVRVMMEARKQQIITLYRINKSSREIAAIINRDSTISVTNITVINYLREWGEIIHQRGGARPGSRYGRRKGFGEMIVR